jgi:hypothetical protein
MQRGEPVGPLTRTLGEYTTAVTSWRFADRVVCVDTAQLDKEDPITVFAAARALRSLRIGWLGSAAEGCDCGAG